MTKPIKTQRHDLARDIGPIVDALRYLQSEASAASLDGVAAALAQAERAVRDAETQPVEPEKALSADEIDLLRSLAHPAGAGPAERRFRLQAFSEISMTLDTGQLLLLANISDMHPAHLKSFMALFDHDASALAHA